VKTLFRFTVPLGALGLIGLFAISATLASPGSAPLLRPAETRTAEAMATASALTSTAIAQPAAAPTQSPSTATGIRRPLGVYARVDLTEFIAVQKKADHSITPAELETKFEGLFAGLLANPAISGLTIGVHWDVVNPNPPTGAAQPYDWTYLDAAFNQVALWNSQHPTAPPKTVQLITSAGFNSPQWVFNQIPSCDPLFTPGEAAPSNCGKVTITGYTEAGGGDGTVLPLPWNPVYQNAWETYLKALAARYGSNPAFVSITVAGPTAASTEMFLPSDKGTPNQTQFGGITPDDMWRKLFALQYPNQPAYQNSDQAFIDAWENAIDLYGQVFSGVTFVMSPDTGGLPDFSQSYPPPPSTDTLYSNGDCSAPDMDCAAITMILTHFIDPTVDGNNAKSTQTGGLKAFNGDKNIGVPGVKLLAQMTEQLAGTARILGGEQFDHSFVTDEPFEGCPTKTCTGTISAEQGEFNVLKALFDGTPAATSFDGNQGSAPLDYLQVDYQDVQYATANVKKLTQVDTGSGNVMMSAQDLLNLASQKLLQIAAANGG